jgi:hypothetical protein
LFYTSTVVYRWSVAIRVFPQESPNDGISGLETWCEFIKRRTFVCVTATHPFLVASQRDSKTFGNEEDN